MASDLLLYGGFIIVFLVLWGAIYVLLPLVRHGHAVLAPTLARAAVRWAGIGRFTDRFKAYAPIAVIVVLGAIATAWAGDGFLDLAELMHSKSDTLQVMRLLKNYDLLKDTQLDLLPDRGSAAPRRARV